MGKLRTFAPALALAIAVAVGFGVNQGVAQGTQAGKKAPAFSGKASDGKTYSLTSLTASKKPTLLYFIGSTCPVNAQAVKYYNSLANAYKGKVNFIGVIDADKAGYDKWQARFKSPFPVVFDPELKIIGAYKAERSPWSVMVDSKGVIVDEWQGYSVEFLNEMGSSLAKGSKSSVVKVNTEGAPGRPTYG